ncbi:MAG: dephospho-CoA kinase [Candidatus Omnitrophica bacterium]|nr:dephospho-CoA kinase [Candidatus Omnitrophota bacterium]
MTVIGLTGGFGTGKTFVGSIFRSLGAKVIDADRIAHTVIKKDSIAYRKIISVFGRDILDMSASIDRRKLGKIVFESPSKLQRLNRIVHPEVIKIIRKKLKSFRRRSVTVIDAPLLIEAGLASSADKIIVVKCSEKVQTQRCGNKFRIEREEILKRIENQLPIRKKMGAADFVIDNSRTRSRTRAQVRRVWKEIVWK